MVDPELEVVPKDEYDHGLSVEELAQSSDLHEQYYGKYDGDSASMVEILGSRENNTCMSYSPGA